MVSKHGKLGFNILFMDIGTTLVYVSVFVASVCLFFLSLFSLSFFLICLSLCLSVCLCSYVSFNPSEQITMVIPRGLKVDDKRMTTFNIAKLLGRTQYQVQ